MAMQGSAEAKAAAFVLEEYDPAPSVELLCAVCGGVLTDPVECPCRHVFCSGCIHEWLGKNSPPTCPMCRQQVEATALIPVLPLVRSLLDRLTVKCRNAGCNAKVEVGSCGSHANKCEFGNETCPHEGCKHQCTRKEMEIHVNQCPFRKVLCHKNCGLQITAVDQGKHSCRKELMEKLQEETAKRKLCEEQVEMLQHTQKQLMITLFQLSEAMKNLKGMIQDMDSKVILATQENAEGAGKGAQEVA